MEKTQLSNVHYQLSFQRKLSIPFEKGVLWSAMCWTSAPSHPPRGGFVFRGGVSGWRLQPSRVKLRTLTCRRLPRTLQMFSIFHTAKVRHFSCATKFQASNWADFQHEFERFCAGLARNLEALPRTCGFLTQNSEFSFYMRGSFSGKYGP